jgi:hypothetical protein
MKAPRHMPAMGDILEADAIIVRAGLASAILALALALGGIEPLLIAHAPMSDKC